MNLGQYPQFVLRLGLVIVFGVFGIDKIVHWPLGMEWSAWMPAWLPFMPGAPFMFAMGVIETIAAVLLLIGKYVRIVALACAFLLAGIVVSFGFNEIMIRDLGILAMALALALMPEHRQYHELHQLVRRLRR